MTLPEYLPAIGSRKITIRTKDGSEMIYVGAANRINWRELNTYCTDTLKRAFQIAQNNYKNAATNKKRMASKKSLDLLYRYMQNAMDRYKAFIPVEQRSIADIFDSEAEPGVTHIVVTGTEGGVKYTPKRPKRSIADNGVYNYIAGMYKQTYRDLVPLYQQAALMGDVDGAYGKILAIESFLNRDPTGTLDGSRFIKMCREEAGRRLLSAILAGKPKRKDSGIMNRIILSGRLTADPELKEGRNSGDYYTRFCIAVPRRANEGADFINCVAFGKSAQAICDYLGKGRRIMVQGRACVEPYEVDGQRRYDYHVIVEQWEFADSKPADEGAGPSDRGRRQDDRREQRGRQRERDDRDRRERDNRERGRYDDRDDYDRRR